VKRFVIDASVAIKWVVQEAGSADALALRKHELVAPELIVPECSNILWKKVQRAELTSKEAAIAAGLLRRSGIGLLTMQDMLEETTAMAIDINHPAYDCIYMIAARREGVPLVTADSRLANKIGAIKTLKSPKVLALGDPATA
jgi:predicted nucleic acid-binding protein